MYGARQNTVSRGERGAGRKSNEWSMKRNGLKMKVMGVDVGSTAVGVANSVEAG